MVNVIADLALFYFFLGKIFGRKKIISFSLFFSSLARIDIDDAPISESVEYSIVYIFRL